MLEDLEEDAGLIERALRKEKIAFSSIRVDTREDFVEVLGSFSPDIILSDHSLPYFNSIEALRVCKEQAPDIPFLLVTGAVSEEFAVSCLKQGADDYVLKSNLSRLPQAMKLAMQKRNAERTRRQQELELKTQNLELTKINQELDSFVYSVSHNLRSPLSSILGLVNLARLEDKQGNAAMHTYLEMIERSVHKLDETLKEILDYSRNARSEVHITEIDLKSMIDSTLQKLRYLRGYERVEKIIKINGQHKVYSDAYRLAVILSNLFSNAIKFYNDQEEKSYIKVSATHSDRSLVILVEDNGIGIEEHFLADVFNMFYRATEKSEGAGLGLYIVKEMVSKLNGSIEIKSELHKGTAITVTIPNAAVQ